MIVVVDSFTIVALVFIVVDDVVAVDVLFNIIIMLTSELQMWTNAEATRVGTAADVVTC